MRKTILYSLVLVLLGACNTENKQANEKIMVFAAASLTDVMTELVDSFEMQSHSKVILNLASSGTLARQMEQGSVPDVFLSASKRWADYVVALSVVDSSNQLPVAKNNLVLIAPIASELAMQTIDSTLNLTTLLGNEKLSMGDPNHVPAGKYAKQALAYYGWYTSVEKQILPAKDVRSALMMVELGECPLGIVYATDAQKSKKVKVLGVFNAQSHAPIYYIASLCSSNEKAQAFYQYIKADKASLIWQKYGFVK